MGRSNAGRPTIMTEVVLGKLEEAFAYGASDKEACFYAGINPDTLYEYQKKQPEYAERKEALKLRPILAARKKVVEAIEADVKNAQWYLERKAEFGMKQTIEIKNPAKQILDKFGLIEEGDARETPEA